MKRFVFKLAIFLLLGAIVNVVVAWGCALWSKPYAKESAVVLASDDSGFPFYYVTEYKSFGAKVNTVHGSAGEHFFGIPESPYLFDLLPRWIDQTDFRKFRINTFDARGWPMQSLWSALEDYNYVNSPECQVHGGLRVGQSQVEAGWRQVPLTIPLRPIWPGFAINTIFYAVFLWLLTFGPFTARRVIRRKRGLCIKCGYDLQGNSEGGCPECGWQRDDGDNSMHL
ncbi:MAG: hypothetical protein IH984_11190 [Planctomycetes bacterium]|nr:hypothetical protein [Planctomycetota bacterium]